MKSKIFKVLKTLLLVTVIGCVASVAWAGVHYLRTAPRFNVKQIAVQGLKRVNDDDVNDRVKLKPDTNTNIFAVDMDDVRKRVEQIQWVRYVTVHRVLPDQIVIRVVEREPIGLARIQGRIYEFDSDATILNPVDAAMPELPILDGLHESEKEDNLKKIAMYSRVLSDLGADGLSEVIINLHNEVSVVRNDESLIVSLGVGDFKERWSHYLALKTKIDTDYKDAVRVDLRFRDRVIVSMQNDDDGKVIWDGKKRSL